MKCFFFFFFCSSTRENDIKNRRRKAPSIAFHIKPFTIQVITYNERIATTSLHFTSAMQIFIPSVQLCPTQADPVMNINLGKMHTIAPAISAFDGPGATLQYQV